MSQINQSEPQTVRITQTDAVNLLWEETRKINYGAAYHDQLRSLKDWVIKTLMENVETITVQVETITVQAAQIKELQEATAQFKEDVLVAIENEGKVIGSIEPVEPKDGYEPGSGPI